MAFIGFEIKICMKKKNKIFGHSQKLKNYFEFINQNLELKINYWLTIKEKFQLKTGQQYLVISIF